MSKSPLYKIDNLIMSPPPTELGRYAQQIKLDEIGVVGQLKLKQARVLCVGAGGLGSPLLLYLAASGIGTLGIIDPDVVELSNLHRQVLYRESDLGQPKALSAKAHLLALNSQIKVEAHVLRLDRDNVEKLFSQYDIIADCSDNFETRYLVNEICFQLNKPSVFASIDRFEGQCAVFAGKDHPCLRCLFPSPDLSLRNCSEAGVLGVLPGLLGVIQANEILKWILQIGTSLSEQLLTVDIQTLSFRRFQIQRNEVCPFCVLKQSFNSHPIFCHSQQVLSPAGLQEKLQANEKIVLLDVRSKEEHALYNLGGLLIPLPELRERLTELNPNDMIVVYCQSGPRSIQALSILKKAQFRQVQYLEGGVAGWRGYQKLA
jgi:molybdopterin/thiamine biosynthesis adenylyltransferase/rhodanese-related sulfurtransferase